MHQVPIFKLRPSSILKSASLSSLHPLVQKKLHGAPEENDRD